MKPPTAWALLAALALVSSPSSRKVAADELPDAVGSAIEGPGADDASPPPSPGPTATTTATTTPVTCESLHFDCFGCIANGCYWCPTDAACFDTPEFVSREPNKQKLYPGRFHNCKTPDDFTQTTCTAPGNFFADPMYSAQKWIFDNVKVEAVWEKGYIGTGVRVRVNDAGIEVDHPEFLGRVDLNASCPQYEPAFSTTSHGMTVASLVGANANNDNCGVGIAPGVTLSSCTLGSMSNEEILVYKLDEMDISQNSWAFEGCGKNSISQAFCNGPDCERKLQTTVAPQPFCPFGYRPFDGYSLFPCDHCTFTETNNRNNAAELGQDCINTVLNHCEFYPQQENRGCMEFLDLILLNANARSNGECHFGFLSEDAIAAFAKGVTEGRDGKGVVYVFAAGNEFQVGDDTNFQGYGANTRFTIPVAAIGKPGNASSYSTPGASVFVAAPGGDDKQSVTRVVAASNGGTCTDSGTGTSFAAPVVSGVVALMLNANPDLTWRDVKYILAFTAQVKNDGDDPTFAMNGAGKIHSNRYGFGIVNADEAVSMSETWSNIGPERTLVREGSGKIHIPDDVRNATRLSLEFSHGSKFITEHVYLYLKLNHSSRGQLRIDLTSPSGMISVLSPGNRPEAQQWGWMKFTSVRYWGEDPTGKWTIQIIDTTPGDVNDCIDHIEYRFPFGENNTIGCDGRDSGTLLQFCENGAVNPEGFWASMCNDKNTTDTTMQDIACDTIEQFTTGRSAGLTGPEACCQCGGGFSPDLLPEEVLEWKIVLYGHDKMPGEGFFSGVEGSTELGKWGDRGRVYVEDRFQAPDSLDPLPCFQTVKSAAPPPPDTNNVRRRGI